MTDDPVMWVTAADVAEYLGPGVDAADPYLAKCAAAAGSFCFRRRAEAGYSDSPLTAPSDDVQLGTVMYGGALYRERGSADSFASFDETIGYATTGTWPRVKQLLGVGRGRVDTPLSELPVAVPLRQWRPW
jgi:hypothetical protein